MRIKREQEEEKKRKEGPETGVKEAGAGVEGAVESLSSEQFVTFTVE